jgi:hypothetical protein
MVVGMRSARAPRGTCSIPQPASGGGDPSSPWRAFGAGFALTIPDLTQIDTIPAEATPAQSPGYPCGNVLRGCQSGAVTR